MKTNQKILTTLLVAMAPLSQVYAFGMADVIDMGIQAGGKIVGAVADKAVDSIKDSFRDPKAEAQQKAEQQQRLDAETQKNLDQIESAPGMRPIDRQRRVLALQATLDQTKALQQMAVQAEEQRKAQRDQILTVGGIVGAVGQAALNTPSAAVAQADALTRNPAYRAQYQANAQAAFHQADAMVASGQGKVSTNAVMNQLGLSSNTAKITAATDSASQPHGAELLTASATTAPSLGVVSGQQPTSEPAPFAEDKGKKVWVEFEHDPTETEMLRQLLVGRGYLLAQRKEEAEIVYLFEGEFTIPETKRYDGLSQNMGDILTHPDQALAAPARKTMGDVSAGMGHFLLAASGVNLPEQPTGYRQEALLVMARQPKGAKETRFYSDQWASSQDIQAVELSEAARNDLYQQLGIGSVQPLVSSVSVSTPTP